MASLWSRIEEGDELPILVTSPGLADLVKFSAGSGNFSPLHYDYEFPQSKALGTIVVHGRFKYAALGQLVWTWLNGEGKVRKLTCRYRGMDVPGRKMSVGGNVVRKWQAENGERCVELELWVKNLAGDITTSSSALAVIW